MKLPEAVTRIESVALGDLAPRDRMQHAGQRWPTARAHEEAARARLVGPPLLLCREALRELPGLPLGEVDATLAGELLEGGRFLGVLLAVLLGGLREPKRARRSAL